jgi:hypothetical protein
MHNLTGRSNLRTNLIAKSKSFAERNQDLISVFIISFYAILTNREIAEDVLQETFTRYGLHLIHLIQQNEVLKLDFYNRFNITRNRVELIQGMPISN